MGYDRNDCPIDFSSYSSCFLMLNPFGLADNQVPIDSFSDFDHQGILAHAQPLPWGNVLKSFPEISHRDILTAIYSTTGLFKPNSIQQSILDRIFQDDRILTPVEGNLSPFLLPDVQWLVHERGDNRFLRKGGTRSNPVDIEIPVEDALRWWVFSGLTIDPGLKFEKILWAYSMFQAKDKSWAIIPSAEAIHTYLFGTFELIHRFVSSRRIEGFWMDVASIEWIDDVFFWDSIPDYDQFTFHYDPALPLVSLPLSKH